MKEEILKKDQNHFDEKINESETISLWFRMFEKRRFSPSCLGVDFFFLGSGQTSAYNCHIYENVKSVVVCDCVRKIAIRKFESPNGAGRSGKDEGWKGGDDAD